MYNKLNRLTAGTVCIILLVVFSVHNYVWEMLRLQGYFDYDPTSEPSLINKVFANSASFLFGFSGLALALCGIGGLAFILYKRIIKSTTPPTFELFACSLSVALGLFWTFYLVSQLEQ